MWEWSTVLLDHPSVSPSVSSMELKGPHRQLLNELGAIHRMCVCVPCSLYIWHVLSVAETTQIVGLGLPGTRSQFEWSRNTKVKAATTETALKRAQTSARGTTGSDEKLTWFKSSLVQSTPPHNGREFCPELSFINWLRFLDDISCGKSKAPTFSRLYSHSSRPQGTSCVYMQAVGDGVKSVYGFRTLQMLPRRVRRRAKSHSSVLPCSEHYQPWSAHLCVDCLLTQRRLWSLASRGFNSAIANSPLCWSSIAPLPTNGVKPRLHRRVQLGHVHISASKKTRWELESKPSEYTFLWVQLYTYVCVCIALYGALWRSKRGNHFSHFWKINQMKSDGDKFCTYTDAMRPMTPHTFMLPENCRSSGIEWGGWAGHLSFRL